MKLRPPGRGRGSAPRDQYGRASAAAGRLWDRLDELASPLARMEVYSDLERAYEAMACHFDPGSFPPGCDAGLKQDLELMSCLCFILGSSEYKLSVRYPQLPEGGAAIPGVSDDPDLAAAWRQFWDEPDRAERARLLRGTPVGLGKAGRPAGIIPLTRLHLGDNIGSMLERAAVSEEILAGQLAAGRRVPP